MRCWKIKTVGILALSIILLAGCGKKEGGLDPKNPTSVVVWHYYNGNQKEAFDALVGRFNDTTGAEMGIIVSAESKGDVGELASMLADSADKKVGSEELPDVAASYVDTAYSLYKKEMLVDIRPYLTEEEVQEYIPAFIEEGELKKGELYVMPVAKSTELFYLNETDWKSFAEETGAAERDFATWEGLTRVAQKYYEWSGGKAFFGRDAFANYIIIGSHQLGKDIFKVEDGAVTVQLDETAMKRLWDNYAAPYLKGYYGAYGRFRSDDVKTGDMVACVAATSSVSYYPQEIALEDGTTYPIKGKVYGLPNFEGTKACSVQQGAGMAVLKSNETTEEAAVEFLKWFTEAAQNTEFCVNSGYLPVKSAANTEENMEKAFEEAGNTGQELILENAKMGVNTFNHVELYTNPPFESGNDYRNILTEYMTEWLDDRIGSVKGKSEEEQEKQLDLLFQQWLSGLKKDLIG